MQILWIFLRFTDKFSKILQIYFLKRLYLQIFFHPFTNFISTHKILLKMFLKFYKFYE